MTANSQGNLDDFPHPFNIGIADEPGLFEAWVKGKSTLKKKEIAKLFQWDAKDGKVSDTPEDFGKYLLAVFASDLASGWSLSEEVDPIKLLPLVVQKWYNNLYSHNKTLLFEAFQDDERHQNLLFTELIKEIFDDPDQREGWETATPDCPNMETSCAVSEILFILEYDSDMFKTMAEYRKHCNQWKMTSFELFKEKLIRLVKDNDTYCQEYFEDRLAHLLCNEDEFIASIDFDFIFNFLKDDYNKWP